MKDKKVFFGKNMFLAVLSLLMISTLAVFASCTLPADNAPSSATSTDGESADEIFEESDSESNEEHKHDYEEEVVAPTCTEQGYTTYECIVCGDSYVGDYTSALGHNYVNGVCTRCEEKGYILEGDYIYFGSYPQGEVTDSSLKTTLGNLAGSLPTNGSNKNWTSYKYYYGNGDWDSESNSTDYMYSTDYMWYQDISYNGKKYRGVYFTSYRPYYTYYSSSEDHTNQDNNGYYISNVYWFKYEPIKWRILEKTTSNGKTYATILCEMIIDSQEYNYTSNSRTIDGKKVYANNYAYSCIRAWLNDNFYNTAFNGHQQSLIQTVEVDNSARSTNPDNNATQWNSGNNIYACENTNDKVWLLSEQEVTRAAYGFSTSYSEYDTVRRKKTTAYAQCQGARTITYSNYAGNGWWWLRSPYYDHDDDAGVVLHDYYAGSLSSVDYTGNGVCPALQICLE
ncbi:MAG: hypothetical protein IJ706_07310 [Clostridia bacterium]|nr:hypothetical protein [Clostridia bacterium]